MIQIQLQMAARAIELLVLPEDTPCYILDIGYDCMCVINTDLLFIVNLIECDI